MRACEDCGSARPWCPPLKEEIWAKIGRYDQVFCLLCAERRLGRVIEIDDLKDCGWNDYAKHVADLVCAADPTPFISHLEAQP